METPFQFDLDENGILKLTADNVERINFIIENDSNYRIFEDPDSQNSITILIRNNPDATVWDKDFILKLVIEIDKQNSTHQEASGRQKGDGQGREKTAQFILDNWEDLLPKIKEGDADAVNIIAKALLNYDPATEQRPKNKGRYTFSFASKFCTYVSNALYVCKQLEYKEDAYSIFDKVVGDVLPYYAWKYLGNTTYVDKKNSNIDKKFGGKSNDIGNYEGYRQLIDSIIDENQKQTGYKIKRRDFDHLLWYYFKGDEDILDADKRYLHKSRITTALEKVIEAKKRQRERSKL